MDKILNYKNQIITVDPLREQVADIVRTMILRGELKSNQPISERAISQQLNVSTTPVKEAFRILVSEGFIYVKPRKGTYVSAITNDFLQQLVYMRSGMEGVAGYYATLYIKPEEIEKLDEIINRIETKLLNEGDFKAVSQLNNSFHSIIRLACRNNYLIHQCNRMNAIDKRIRELSLQTDEVEPHRAFQEHKGIWEAVKSGNPDVTEARLVSHIRRVARLVLE